MVVSREPALDRSGELADVAPVNLSLVPPAPPSVAPRDLPKILEGLLRSVRICGWRVGLESKARNVTLPILRGVFGAALHQTSEQAYSELFRPDGDDSAPAYLLRRSAHQLPYETVFEMILFDRALPHLAAIRAAWEIAGEMGLGRERHRFRVAHMAQLTAGGRPATVGEPAAAFPLSEATWPLAGDPAREPARLLFPEPLRMLRAKQLIERPTLRDLALAACRRLAGLVPLSARPTTFGLQGPVIAAADGIASQPFVGQGGEVSRWSASQRQRIELQGVVGHLDLPEGPGPLWRLFAALQWTHCGKATVLGLGRLVVLPIW